MKKVLLSTLLSISAVFSASADDSTPTIPSTQDGYFISSCGSAIYTTPPSAFSSYNAMIDFYEHLNTTLCGTTDGWRVSYNNVFHNSETLKKIAPQNPQPTV